MISRCHCHITAILPQKRQNGPAGGPTSVLEVVVCHHLPFLGHKVGDHQRATSDIGTAVRGAHVRPPHAMVASLSSVQSASTTVTTGRGHASIAVTYKSVSVSVPMAGDPLLSQGNNAPYFGPMCEPGCRCIDGCICGRPEPEPQPQPSPRPAQAGYSSVADHLAALMALDTAQRRELAAALLHAMDPDELRALLQGMRKFAWEVEAEAQTDHSGPLVPKPLSEEEPPPEEQQPDSSKQARARKYMPQAKRALTSIAKATNSKKAKPISLKKARTLIANIYEEKVMADEACDQQGVRRDELPTFICDFMLHMYGIKSLAMQNLGALPGISLNSVPSY